MNTPTPPKEENVKEADKRRRLVSLTITEACNLNCTYCYEHSKTAARMDIEVAKAALKSEFENSDGFDEIEIDLFGGEPTLHQEFIKELVEWTCASDFKKPFLFFLQTNGTRVHGDFQKWLLDHKTYVWVGLSLDGTRATQNMNRSNSYDLIDIPFFVRNYPAQGVRMTISSDAIKTLAEDVIHLHNLGFTRVDAAFACGINWKIEDAEAILATQLLQLCDYYLVHPELKECSLFDVSISKLTRKEGFLPKWCGTGVEMVSIGVDGKQYPCHSFQPNTNARPIEIGCINFGEHKSYSDPECHSCPLEPICPNCYGLNHLMTGDMLKRDKTMCKITKIRAEAVAYLRAQQIAMGISKMEPIEMYQTIEAIQMLQRSDQCERVVMESENRGEQT